MKPRAVLSSVLALGCVSIGLVGCGSQSQDGVQPGARQRLLGGVQRVKDAVARQDHPAAQTALTELSRDVAASQANGELDANSARAILRASDRVTEDVRAMGNRPGPPPVVVTAPIPSPLPLEQPVPAAGHPQPAPQPDSGQHAATPGTEAPNSGRSGSGSSGSGTGDSGATPEPPAQAGQPWGVPNRGAQSGNAQTGVGERGNNGQGNG